MITTKLRPPRLLAPFRHTAKCRARCYASSSTSSPSPKISVVPFKANPEAALHRLHMNGLLASGANKPSNLLYAALLRIFGPWITPYAQEFGLGESLVLKDMKAAYYPIWRCDGLFEAKTVRVDYLKAGDEKRGLLAVREGYVPGTAFAPLSYLSYAVPDLPEDLPTYDPATDLKQLGEEFAVVPIPFTVTPFALVERLRKLIGDDGQRWHGIRGYQEDWRETLLACYPIMFPIYIAEFEQTTGDNDKWSFQVIMDAHDDPQNCRISWPVPPVMFDRGRLTTNYYVNPAPFLPDVYLSLPPEFVPPPFLRPADKTRELPKPPGAGDVAQAYTQWMSPSPESSFEIAPSPLVQAEEESGAQVDWSDRRIQSWTSEDRQENGQWIDAKSELSQSEGALLHFEASTPPRGELEEKGGKEPTVVMLEMRKGTAPKMHARPISEMRDAMKERVREAKLRVEEDKPRWLQEMEMDEAGGPSLGEELEKRIGGETASEEKTGDVSQGEKSHGRQVAGGSVEEKSRATKSGLTSGTKARRKR